MPNLKKILIFGILLAQIGCMSLAAKEHITNADRLPATTGDIVKLIGAERTPENIQSEDAVGSLILSLRNNFRNCYEKELNSNPALNTELVFYFGVTKGGLIRNITSEVITSTGTSAVFSQCLSYAISRLRPPTSNQDLVFRARLRFQAGQ